MKLTFELFTTFSKIGLFSLGGGLAMLPLIHNAIVTKKGWVKEAEFLDILTVAQSVPGPISLNIAVFTGYRLLKLRGALIVVLGIILPSFISILLIAIFFSAIRDNAVVNAAFKGMRPAVIALIVIPVVTLAQRVSPILWAVIATTALLIWWFELSPILFIIAGALGGIVWTLYISKRVEQ